MSTEMNELGLPILSAAEHAAALADLVREGNREDSAGHVQALVAEFRGELEARGAYQERLGGFEAVRRERDALRGTAWVRPRDRLPERVPGRSYSSVACLVVYRNEVQILVYNHEHECWDDEAGDDFECKPMEVQWWMPLPLPPKEDPRDAT